MHKNKRSNFKTNLNNSEQHKNDQQQTTTTTALTSKKHQKQQLHKKQRKQLHDEHKSNKSKSDAKISVTNSNHTSEQKPDLNDDIKKCTSPSNSTCSKETDSILYPPLIILNDNINDNNINDNINNNICDINIIISENNHTKLNISPNYTDSEEENDLKPTLKRYAFDNTTPATSNDKLNVPNYNDNDDNNSCDISDNESDRGFRDFAADFIDLVRTNDLESLEDGRENLGDEKFAQFSIVSDKRGLSAFTLAAELDRLDIMELMLDSFKDLKNLNDDDDECDDRNQRKNPDTERSIISERPIDTPNLLGGWTALHCASSNDHIDMVNLLLHFGADPNIKDRDGMTALHFAVDRGNSCIVESLLNHGAAVNDVTTIEKYSALYLSSQLGQVDVVKLLLEFGADVEIVDKDEWTALHTSCDKNHPEVVNVLLEHATNLQSKSEISHDNDDDEIKHDEDDNDVYLDATVEIESVGESKKGDIIKKSKDTSVNHKLNSSTIYKNQQNLTTRFVNFQTYDGVTPLYLTAQHGFNDITSTLIAHNANPNICENDGFAPLHVACQTGHLETLSVLLTSPKCDVNIPACTDTAWKPIHFAAQENHHEIISMLLKHGADVNAKTTGGHTPLHVAAECGRVEAARILLVEGKADAFLVDDAGWSPLHHASQNGCKDVVDEILKHYRHVDDDCQNIDKLSPSVLGTTGITPLTGPTDEMTPIDRLINQKTNDGEDALLIAVTNDHLKVVELLLNYGVKITSKIRNKSIQSSTSSESYQGLDNQPNTDSDSTSIVLHAACQANNVEMVKCLLKYGAPFNNKDEHNWTPLHFVAENDSIDCLDAILSAARIRKAKSTRRNSSKISNSLSNTEKIKPNMDEVISAANNNEITINDDDDCTPSPVFSVPFSTLPFNEDQKVHEISTLSSQTSITDVTELLNLNAQTDEGYTAVFIAAHNKSLKVLKRLLDLGAKADIVNHLGWTALHAASEVGWMEGIQLLLASSSTDVNRKTYHGFTALYLAAQENRINTVDYLLTVVLANPNMAENQGFCPLHVAAQKGWVECVELLLSNGALGNKTDSNGWTALHLAVQDDHLQAVETLIKHGVDVDAQTSDGVTSLMMAVIKMNVQVVDLLLQYGANTEFYDTSTGHTALHTATELGHLTIVEKLLAAGADVEAETKIDRMKSLHIVMRMHADEEQKALPLIKALLAEGADTKPAVNCGGISPLHLAAQKGWNLVVKLLTDYGASVDSIDDAGWTPLMFASRYGKADTAKLLLASGAKPDIKPDKEMERVCALLLAVQNGYINVVETLVLWSCDVNATTSDGTTALYCAAQCGDLDMVQILLYNGADPNIMNRRGFIPLHPACLNGHRRVVESLIKAGSEVDQQARDGTRPVQLADRNGHEEIVELLVKQHGAKVPDYEERYGITNVFGQWGTYLKNVVAKVYRSGLDEYARLAGDDSSVDGSGHRNRNKYNEANTGRQVNVEKVEFNSTNRQSMNQVRRSAGLESARRVYKV